MLPTRRRELSFLSTLIERRDTVAEQTAAASNILALIERRDWERLRPLLHPAVRWTTAVEDELVGPVEVIACLKEDPPPAPPAYHELRDGLVYRWIDTPG